MRSTFVLMGLLTLSLLTACGGHDDHGYDHGDTDQPSPFATVSKAVGVLAPTEETSPEGVRGTVTFTQTKHGLLIDAKVTGLRPNSKHALRVHEWGDVSDADAATATGGLYDPEGKGTHGLPTVHSHGDHSHGFTGGSAAGLGNLQADAQGNAVYSETYENITLTGNNALLGRAIVICLNEDDGTEPDGNAGAVIAQGVIGIANPE